MIHVLWDYQGNAFKVFLSNIHKDKLVRKNKSFYIFTECNKV